MRTTKFLFLLLFAIAGMRTIAFSASIDSPAVFYISILEKDHIPSVYHNGNRVDLVFEQSGLNMIVAHYQVYDCYQAFPHSRFPHMQQVYVIACDDLSLMDDLMSYDRSIFDGGQIVYPAKQLALPLDYLPNNQHADTMKDLKLIRAPQAWEITTGSPNTVIGVSDGYVHRDHIELRNKVVAGYPNPLAVTGASINHGTAVSGIIAARTNNSDSGVAAIAYNCRVKNYAKLSDSAVLTMSRDGLKIINCSWGYGYCQPKNAYNLDSFAIQQSIYTEVYENGTSAVFAAGNGNIGQLAPCDIDGFHFPASLDHNISVTSVGHINPPGSGTYSMVDEHNFSPNVPGNPPGYINSHNHNNMVDICAPGYGVFTLNYDTAIANSYPYQPNITGTSAAAPYVSGTMGLMQTVKECLSPYQREYLLKTMADNISTPANSPFAGQLGAGRLNAGRAVEAAARYDCNTPATQTMYIKGIEINTLCPPGDGLKPQLRPVIVNGTPPYTYRWEELPGNAATLDNPTSAAPFITSVTAAHRAWFRVTVYDASRVTKVASKIIKAQLLSNVYDLAVRDSYMDMLDQPNSQMATDPREWQIWQSPDIWNRQYRDGDTNHVNPEYYNIDSNYLYVRVRNVGCATSPATGNNLRLYWTKASTGEKWRTDWVNGGGANPATGGEIFSASMQIPAIPAGQSITLVRGWRPPKPESYGLTQVDVCVLARIEEAPAYPFGMALREDSNINVKVNVINNNNICTRNLVVENKNPGNKNTSTVHQVEVASAEHINRSFSIRVSTEKDNNPHFAGNLSDYLYAVIHLGDLYDRWMEGEAMGQAGIVNADERTITYDPATPIQLDNIMLKPGEVFPVNIEFITHPDAAWPYDIYDQQVHFQQITYSHEKEYSGEVYGNTTYQFNFDNETADPETGPEGGIPVHKGSLPGDADELLSDNRLIRVYPNPATDQLHIYSLSEASIVVNILITDPVGRNVYARERQVLGKAPFTIPVGALTPGIYYLNIVDENGGNKRVRFIKQL